MVDNAEARPDEDGDSDAALCEASKNIIKQMEHQATLVHPLRIVFEQVGEQPAVDTHMS